MRLVLDTNAVVSGLLWHGTPGTLIEAARKKTVHLFTSAPLLAELRSILSRDKFARQLHVRGLTPKGLVDGYGALAVIVVPASIWPVIVQDPPDDVVLATALAAQADLIVSGDARVLNLKRYQNIPIVDAANAVARLALH